MSFHVLRLRLVGDGSLELPAVGLCIGDVRLELPEREKRRRGNERGRGRGEGRVGNKRGREGAREGGEGGKEGGSERFTFRVGGIRCELHFGASCLAGREQLLAEHNTCPAKRQLRAL